MIRKWGGKEAAGLVLGISPHTVKDWRMKGILREGIEFVRLNTRSVRYNLFLLEAMMAHAGDPATYQKIVERYLSELPGNEPRRPGRPRKDSNTAA